MLTKAILITLLGVLAVQAAFPEDEKVTQLDQMPDLSFGLYSGYVKINDAKSLHYIVTVSQGDWKVDPVIVWFNGGPGCSSLLAWAQEHGPYVLEDGATTFVKNKFAWNNEATVIYIESPATVGYSQCKSGCTFSDETSADDNLVAVLGILKKYSDLQTNDLYISGESYAGIYVPFLVSRLD